MIFKAPYSVSRILNYSLCIVYNNLDCYDHRFVISLSPGLNIKLSKQSVLKEINFFSV